MTALSGCSNQSSQKAELETDFNQVIDVPISGWAQHDTLIFPLEVTWPANVKTPLQKGLTYQLGYSIRITSGYPLTNVPMHLIVQQTDTTGLHGHERVIRNLLRCNIEPRVRNDEGYPLGSDWGSLIDYEAQLDSITLQFDSVGTYRIMLTPRTGSLTEFEGIASVGLQLNRPL